MSGYIIVGIISIGAVALGIYQILKYMKGSIKIILPQTGFVAGEKITGFFEMRIKQNVESKRLLITLIGQEITRYRGSKGSTRTRTEEVYRNEIQLSDGRPYRPGEYVKKNFEIDVPSKVATGAQSSPLGKLFPAGLNILVGNRTYQRWYVEARLDAKGVDLSARKKISIDRQMGNI